MQNCVKGNRREAEGIHANSTRGKEYRSWLFDYKRNRLSKSEVSLEVMYTVRMYQKGKGVVVVGRVMSGRNEM